MEITDRAMNNLSFALGLTENTDANTLMLNAAVRINRLTSEIKAAYGTLQMFGVPEQRAKSVVNGIMVLVSRIDKESEFQVQEIVRLREAVMQCYQIASSHEFGTDAAKTIRETFALEI